MNRLVAAFLSLLVSLGFATNVVEAICTGDCDGNGQVTVDELVSSVNIALGTTPVGESERKCRRAKCSEKCNDGGRVACHAVP